MAALLRELLIRHGESIKTVQERLGHKDATETLNTYSHLWPDSDDRTRAAVDEVLGDVRGRSAHANAPKKLIVPVQAIDAKP